MFDERRFLARVEAADAHTFAELLEQPSEDETRALRVQFGDARYQRLHSLALRRGRSARTRSGPIGNVVVIHSFLGSNLTGWDHTGNEMHIWPNVLAIAGGQLTRLKLADNGLVEAAPGEQVRATSVVKRYYGELLLTLAESWNIHAFTYDWRKDLDVAADELRAELSGWFDERAPVHLVAHGMGGLVARTFIEKHPARWASMWDTGDGDRAPGTLGGRLVMLGTANHGSFEIVRTVAGLGRTIQRLAQLDRRNSERDLIRVFTSFVGPWQMLPSKLERPELAPLYDLNTYGDEIGVTRYRLATGEEHHARLREVVEPSRMISVNGSNRPTVDGIVDIGNLSAPGSYTVTWDGDGWISASLARLAAPDGTPVPAFYVDEDHGGLPANRTVLSTLDDVLRTGTSSRLHTTPPTLPGGNGRDAAAALDRMIAARESESEQFTSLLTRSRSWRMATDTTLSRPARGPGDTTSPITFASTDEVTIEEFVTQGVVSAPDTGTSGPIVPFRSATIQIRVVAGNIEDLDSAAGMDSDADPIEVIAVGHYLGGTPHSAELALDRAISARPDGGDGSTSPLHESDLMLTQLAERGTVRGELGQIFLLDDPRESGKGQRGPTRLIALAGMGLPGRFGEPELTVVARELCWALGRMGKRHLATILIGAGRGNLSPRDTTHAWLRGIKYAITGSTEDERRALRRVTFVERDPDRIREIQRAIVDEQLRMDRQNRLVIDFQPLGEDLIQEWAERCRSAALTEAERTEQAGDGADDPVLPSRLTVTLEGQQTYRFGAITEEAAIPEREIPIDPRLIEQANDELAAARDLETQFDRGQFLEELLLPDEFRGQVFSSAPLVMMLDPTMARIHWEMIAQSDYELMDMPASDAGRAFGFDPRLFLGTSRGITRQLRTTFAQPPDPPPPPRRLMRVLIVADPAADNRLPGAEAEGAAVAELFEQFNIVHERSENRVEVVTLLGPQEATRTNVLRQLVRRSYDVLHFAGHCVYDKDNPRASGWIFTDNTRITAAELHRIDRIPNFVFSNACESGITPDRSELRSAALGPTFAEEFFSRGVTNFVCTAWPVDDLAAREFALTLYERLLGFRPVDAERRQYLPTTPEQMHVAMRDARLAIAENPLGMQTWGAYQHYGTPYMRFFDPSKMPLPTA